MKSSRTLLVDGDIVAYKAAVIAETPIDWGNVCGHSMPMRKMS